MQIKEGIVSKSVVLYKTIQMKQLHKFISLLILLCFIVSCKDSSQKEDISKISEKISPGLIFTKTDDLEEAAENFKSYVDTDRTLEISTAIDHVQNAKDVNLELTPNEVYYVDNPRYSIPLIEENPMMAFEFPIRIGFYEIDGENFIVSRSENYFLNRYNLPKSAALRSIGALSETFLKQSSKAAYTQDSPIDSLNGNGIISRTSSKSFKETISSLEKEIQDNEDLILFESKDFTKEAAGIGASLRPLHLFVFGNPKVGTKLMQQNPNFSIDLPLKFIVEETEDNKILVHFQDLNFTAKLHSAEFEDDLPNTITKNLEQLLSRALPDEEQQSN